jgi:aldehyde:ferredoxin oxidoreductase
MELFQRGIISREDCDGLSLDWGNAAAAMAMLRKIALRVGIGDTLAEGSIRAAQIIGKGSEKYTVTVKGMELFRTEPRLATTASVIGYAVSPRGGEDQLTTLGCPESFTEDLGITCREELESWVDYLDMPVDVKRAIYGQPPTLDALDGGNFKRKAAVVKWYQELTAVTNSLGLCLHAGNFSGAMGPSLYAELYTAATGRETTAAEIMRAGERIFNLMRAYLVRQGITRKDDRYPARFYDQPLPDGPRRGAVLSRPRMDEMLDRYYELVGWHRETGIPRRDKLIELDLGDVADELSAMNTP